MKHILKSVINGHLQCNCTLKRKSFVCDQGLLFALKRRPPFFRCQSTTKATKKEITFKNALENIPKENIRNFSIIAHVDHGKSTLSDRLLEFTGMILKTGKNEQVLDKLQVERERGITVKAQTASMLYTLNDKTYLLNLIDTPGHVDFSYEVARSLVACQGAILLVDANQGVQAQTVANFNLAFCNELAILPVMNKIDLQNSDIEGTASQMKKLFEIDAIDIIKVSAKLGIGIEELLEAIVTKIPPPPGDELKPFRGLIFDSWFDKYRGVVALVAIADGKVKVGDEIIAKSTGQSYQIRDLGVLAPEEILTSELRAGQAGFLSANIRNSSEAKMGETLHHKGVEVEKLPPIPAAKPMVFAGLYPADQSQLSELRGSLEKLLLNDSSVDLSFCSSPALGQGWRLGFLGLLHMEVFCQRLDQEFDAQVVVTAPNVSYKAKLRSKKSKSGFEEVVIKNPLEFPDKTVAVEYLEPMVNGTIISPDKFFGALTSLCMERRGVGKHTENIDNSNIMMQYKFPLSEVIIDFFDELKSITSGYASFDYEDCGYEISDLVQLTFKLNGVVVEELTLVVHATRAATIGRSICLKLKDTLPGQLYAVAIQAAVGGKIVARENMKAMRKNVLAKCYGGDVTRKMKLLKRQAEGKKKMRLIGNVEVPRDAFIKILKK